MVRKALITLLLAASIVPAAAAGVGNGNAKAKPLDPTQAQTLVSTAGASLGTSVTAISKDDALAASRQAGAQTEVASGFATTQQAIAASTGCASYQSGWGWGTWPYDQQVYDHTYYCAVTGDHITYRSTTVTTGGTLCGTESRNNWIVSGGIGSFWMVVHAEARFSCPTVVPWVTLHPTDWLETSYNAWGNAAQVGHS
jgi:hypothetical protein